MRYWCRGVTVGMQLVMLLMCGRALSKQDQDIQIQYHEYVQKDCYGNPTKLVIDVHAVCTPKIDGIAIPSQSQQYHQHYEYDIDNNNQIGSKPITQTSTQQLCVNNNAAIYQSSSPTATFHVHNHQPEQNNFYYNIKFIEHKTTFLQTLSSSQLECLKRANQYCQFMYQMSLDDLYSLLSEKPEKFQNTILHTLQLCNQAIKELLNCYLNRCKNPEKQKYVDLKNAVHAELEKREEEIQKAIQKKIDTELANKKTEEQKKLNLDKQYRTEWIAYQHEQMHEQLNDLWYWDNLSEQVQQSRFDALQHSRLQNYAQYQQHYNLNADIKGFLQCHDISHHEYEQCFGTALQQQYHQEMCDILYQLSQEQKHGHHSLLYNQSFDFLLGAKQANDYCRIPIVDTMTTVADILCRIGQDVYDKPGQYAQAIVLGCTDSVINTICFWNWIPDVARLIVWGLQTSMMVMELETYVLCYGIANVAQMYQKTLQNVQIKVNGITDHLKTLDGPGRTRLIANLITDFKTAPKIFGAYAAILSRTKNLQSMQHCASLLAEFDAAAETITEFVQEEIKLQPALQEGIADQICTQVAEQPWIKKTPTFIRTIEEILNEFQSLKGVIPFENKNLYQECNKVFKYIQEQLKSAEFKKLTKFDLERTINGKKVKLAVEHACSGELSLVASTKHNGYILHIGGVHLDRIVQMLQEYGIIEIIQKEVLPSKMIRYNLRNTFSSVEFIKTVAPAGWTEKKLIDLIWEIYKDNSLVVEELSGTHLAKTKAIDGIDWQVVWKEKGKGLQIFDFIKTIIPLDNTI